MRAVVPVSVVPDLSAPRRAAEDLRGLSRDLDLLARAVRDLVALQAEIDAGLRRRGIGPHHRTDEADPAAAAAAG